LILNIDNQKVKLQIWGTAGQERFRLILKTYYRNPVGFILVFDLTDRKSFDSLTSWLNDIHALCDSNAVIQPIGNKSDLGARRVVTIVEAESFAKHHQMRYLEASAKVGENVKDAFVSAAAKIMNKGLKTTHQPQMRGRSFRQRQPERLEAVLAAKLFFRNKVPFLKTLTVDELPEKCARHSNGY
jgi:small GTP-binding protein